MAATVREWSVLAQYTSDTMAASASTSQLHSIVKLALAVYIGLTTVSLNQSRLSRGPGLGRSPGPVLSFVHGGVAVTGRAVEKKQVPSFAMW